MGRNLGYQPSPTKNDELIIQFENKWKKYSTKNFSQKLPRNNREFVTETPSVLGQTDNNWNIFS